jgi:hypothetical protein
MVLNHHHDKRSRRFNTPNTKAHDLDTHSQPVPSTTHPHNLLPIIQLNATLPPPSGSTTRTFPKGVPHQNSVCIPRLHHPIHMPKPTNSPRFSVS